MKLKHTKLAKIECLHVHGWVLFGVQIETAFRR